MIIDCKHNDCIFYSNRTVCCLAEIIQDRTTDCPCYKKDSRLMRCAYSTCNKFFESGEAIFHSKYGYHCYICQSCAEKELEENMVQIKQLEIVAKLDGKQVPLETISTETFEAIKALQKPEEIPVARIGHYQNAPNDKRLFLKITDSIRNVVGKGHISSIVAISLQTGDVTNSWPRGCDINSRSELYENIKSL